MSVLSKIKKQKTRRKLRVRKNLKKAYDKTKVRVSMYRSLKYTTGQVIDDSAGKTIFSIGTRFICKKENKTKTEKAFEAGKELGKKLLESNYKEIVFDRGEYLYHGRVKAFADGIRLSGILF